MQSSRSLMRELEADMCETAVVSLVNSGPGTNKYIYLYMLAIDITDNCNSWVYESTLVAGQCYFSNCNLSDTSRRYIAMYLSSDLQSSVIMTV